MLQLNKIILVGNLTRDPELSYLPDQTPVCRLGLAVNTRFGPDKEETLFIDCVRFGKGADTINKYFEKGRSIYVEGRLRLEDWTDKAGEKHHSYRVLVQNWQFAGPPKEQQGGQPPPQAKRATPRPPREDDIPF